jgi:hypothetical protein
MIKRWMAMRTENQRTERLIRSLVKLWELFLFVFGVMFYNARLGLKNYFFGNIGRQVGNAFKVSADA